MVDLVQVAGSVLVVASTMLAIACVLIYLVLARWWQTPIGRHLFSFMAVLAVGLTLWTIQLVGGGHFTGPPHPGAWPYVRLVAFGAFAWVLSWRLLIIVRAQLAERRKRRENR